MAEWISGPRQITGESPVRKYWMLIIDTPCAETGFTRPPVPVTCEPVVPIISGTFGPVISASSSPTRAPSRARLTARLTATVVLPTPPFPDATAMVFRTPGMRSAAGPPKERFTLLAQSTRTVVAPSEASPSTMSDSIFAFSGQAGVVSSTVRSTVLPAISIDLIMPRLTRSRPISGSLTRPRAAMMFSLVNWSDMRRSGSYCVDWMGCPEGSRAGFRVDATFVETNDTAGADRGSPQSVPQRCLKLCGGCAGGGAQVRAGEPIVFGREEGIAHLGAPVAERTIRTGLRHVLTDGCQFQRGELTELHGQCVIVVRRTIAGRRRRTDGRDPRRRHH